MKKKLTALCLAALMTSLSAGALAIEYDLESQGSEVALIQRALLALDYYYGDVTQHYGPRTQRGVRLFQEAYGLDVTGVADEHTRALLYEVTGTTPPDAGDMLLEMNVTLRRGDSGGDVVWLQEGLAELGYYSGEISGNYGNLTKEAVRLFQRANSLSSDGVAGKNTIRALAYAVKAQREAEQFAFSGFDPNAGYDDAPVYVEATVDPESITTLSLGVKNSAVRRLQEDLEALGFYTGTVTGNYGNLTKEAVRLFQRANDIPSDGVAGPITLAEIAEEIEDLRKLNEALSATPVPTPTPQPVQQTPSPTPDRYHGLVQFITPAPTPTATPVRVTPTPKPVSAVNSSVGFLNIQRELKLYDNNEEVRQLQIALESLGYYTGESSGYFDFMTRAAVMGYQAAKGIKLSGNADKVTLITINDDIFRRYANIGD